MADADYHEMEMSRRSIKINTIRQELEDAVEREKDAQERLAQLDRQIKEKKVHISICKANNQEMEDQALKEEAFCLDNRSMQQDDEEAVQREVKALNEELAKTTRSLEKAQTDAMQAQKAVAAQEEANKRQAEDAAQCAAKLAALEAKMAAATADVETIQESIRGLEVTLGMEKQTGKELQDSVNEEEEKRQETQADTDRLQHFLESLSSRGKKEELSQALAAMRLEHSQLMKEFAAKQTETKLQKEDLQARLSVISSSGMVSQERTVNAVTAVEVASLDASAAALTVALEEERRKADAERETRLKLEAEAQALEKELVALELQGPAKQEKPDNQSVALEELHSAQETLDAAKRQLREKEEALQLGREQLAQARQEARNSVEVLWAKLKELWAAIGQVKGFS